MFAEEKLFFETLNELHTRIQQCSEYSIVKASGLLRLLLLDAHPLAVKVCRRVRHKLLFAVKDGRQLDPRSGKIDLSGWACEPFKRIPLGQFLRTGVFSWNEWGFTVHDIIHACAHTKGGIHHGSPKTPKDHAFAQLGAIGRAIGFKDSQLLDLQSGFIVPISRIILEAMIPLVQKLHADNPKQEQA
jgi:hypothetical protein